MELTGDGELLIFSNYDDGRGEMSDYIVKMKCINKNFPGIVANNDVSISLKKGRNVCIT